MFALFFNKLGADGRTQPRSTTTALSHVIHAVTLTSLDMLSGATAPTEFYYLFIVMDPCCSRMSLLSRPHLAWDMKSVPCIDGKEIQGEYASAFSPLTSLHDKLPDSNCNRISHILHSIIVQGQL